MHNTGCWSCGSSTDQTATVLKPMAERLHELPNRHVVKTGAFRAEGTCADNLD